MAFMSRKAKTDNELAKASIMKDDKKETVLQNALNNYEYHKKRKKKQKTKDINDSDNFTL